MTQAIQGIRKTKRTCKISPPFVSKKKLQGMIFLAGLFAFMPLFFLAGCQKDVNSMVESTGTTSVETLPTQPEDLQLRFTPDAEMTKNTPHISPYIKVMVVDVEIRCLETDPVQVEIVIRGTLPDQCKYGFYSVENRNGQNVKVGLDGMHPADNSCLQTAQTIEYVLRLGRDLPEAERGFPPGDYKLTVNNYQTSFSIK